MKDKKTFKNWIPGKDKRIPRGKVYLYIYFQVIRGKTKKIYSGKIRKRKKYFTGGKEEKDICLHVPINRRIPPEDKLSRRSGSGAVRLD